MHKSSRSESRIIDLGTSGWFQLLGTMNYLFSHIADQYPPEIRKKKYQYWDRLVRANEDYRREHDHGEDFEGEKISFYQWMRDQWGLEIDTESADITPYYTVVDEHKYLLFIIKYD
jgi:hypothetical protein